MFNYLLPFIYALIFLFIINKSSFFTVDGLDKKFIYLIFLLKIFSGIGLTVIYSNYYNNRSTSDMFYFFDDSKALYNCFFENPKNFIRIIFGFDSLDLSLTNYLNEMPHWNRSTTFGLPNDNKTIIIFNTLIRFFSFGIFNVHIIFMCFLSLLGQMALFKTFYKVMQGQKWVVFSCCFLIPSVLLWSSALLKDGILFFGMGMYIYYLFKLLSENFEIKNLLMFLIFFLLCIAIKGYALFATFPATLCLFYFRIFSQKQFLIKVLIMHLISLLIIFNLKFFIKDYDVLFLMLTKQKDMINNGIQAGAGSLIYIPKISTFYELVLHSPQALFNSIFRPHILEIKNFLYLLPALENLLLGGVFLLAVFNFKKPRKQYFQLLLFSLSFSIFILLLVGHTVPILGSSIRYRSIALPFLFLSIFIFIDFDKLIKKYTFLHKFNFLLK